MDRGGANINHHRCMTGVTKLRLLRFLTTALLTHVVFVYSDVVKGCVNSCAPR